jgi:hypothetical protein
MFLPTGVYKYDFVYENLLESIDLIYHSRSRTQIAITDFVEKLGAKAHWQRLDELKHFVRMYATTVYIFAHRLNLDIESIDEIPYF